MCDSEDDKTSGHTIELSDNKDEEYQSMENMTSGQKRKNWPGSANELAPALSRADLLFRAIGLHMDAEKAERTMLEKFKQHLWSGDYLTENSAAMESRPQASKARLNRFLDKASEIRVRYHNILFDENKISDRLQSPAHGEGDKSGAQPVDE